MSQNHGQGGFLALEFFAAYERAEQYAVELERELGELEKGTP
jgi:hypothetical protein